MNKKKQVVKVALKRVKVGTVRKWRESHISFPTLSKSNLHNYFADKMAIFSVIIGYVYEKTKHTVPEHTHVPNPFTALYNKLVKMRAGFLYKYHQLNFKTKGGETKETQNLKALYEHIYKFEENVVSEILRREDLIVNNVEILPIKYNK